MLHICTNLLIYNIKISLHKDTYKPKANLGRRYRTTSMVSDDNYYISYLKTNFVLFACEQDRDNTSKRSKTFECVMTLYTLDLRI